MSENIEEVQQELNTIGNENQENFSFADRDEYVKALDKTLNPKHIQSRDIGNGKKQRYYASAVQKATADFMFQEWNVVDLKPIPVKEGFITVQVKIAFVPSYPGADEEFCSGIASILLNSSKNNLEYQLPATTSRAISDALKLKGNIFGRNLATKFNKSSSVPDDFSIRAKVGEKKKEVELIEMKLELQQEKVKKPTPPIINQIPDEDLPF